MAKDLLTKQVATRSRSIDFMGLSAILPNPDSVLRKQGTSIQVYQNLMTDARVGSAVRRRKSAVKAMEMEIEVGSSGKRVHSEIKAIFADLDIERIIDEMLNASLYGYQPMEIEYAQVGGMLCPVDVVGKPPGWFMFDSENNLRFRSKGNLLRGELLPERKFLLPRQSPTFDNPYGFADLSMCFWPLTFKKGGMRFWLTFAEKYGVPFLIGEVPTHATEEQREAMRDELENMVQDAVAVIDSGSKIGLVESGGKSGSVETFKALVEACNADINIALTGTNQTTEKDTNHASASAGQGVSEDLRDGDAAIVAAAFNQLVRWIVELNFGNVARPIVQFWDTKQLEQKRSKRDADNYAAGARFTPKYFMRVYGYQEDDLEQATQAPGTSLSIAAHRLPPECAHQQQHTGENAALAAAWGGILETLENMVQHAGSYENLQAMIATAYGNLPVAHLRTVLAQGLIVAQLAGIVDVSGGQ